MTTPFLSFPKGLLEGDMGASVRFAFPIFKMQNNVPFFDPQSNSFSK